MTVHTPKDSEESLADEMTGGQPTLKSERIEVIGKLADGIAHEMNNVLATIMGLASVLESDIDVSNPLFQDVQGILAASRRGLDLTRNLVSFSQSSKNFQEPVLLNHLVGMVRSLLQRTTPSHVEIETHIASDLAVIRGDLNQIKHALINLATNATDAIQTKGIITFTTSNITLKETDLTSFPNLSPGHYVRLQVSDTGLGMDDETLKQAFDPFFTTKGTARGLGLSLVLNTVEQHGGKVTIFSKSGQGTTVTIDFPAIESTHTTNDIAQKKQPSLAVKSGTVLLVDDENLVLVAGKRLLERLGYTVMVALTGQEALEIYKKNGNDISFVLLDLIMPDMDGLQVLKHLKELDQEVQVIISSGYAREESLSTGLSAGALAFVQKPFTLNELAATLEDAFK